MRCSKLVFASQCYHWSRLTASASTSKIDEVVRAEFPKIKQELDSIAEDIEDQNHDNHIDSDSDSDPDLKSDSSFHSDVSSSASTITPTTPFSDPTPTTQSPILQLPIQALALPSPETYSQLHNLLHFTHSPPPSTFSPLNALLGMNVSDLHKLDNKDLMGRLSVVQGVWKNCCYLGIGDVRIWNGMRDAWGAVVGIVAERSKKVENRMDMDI